MAWSELAQRRTKYARHYQDNVTGVVRFESRLKTPLHYDSTADAADNANTVDMTPQRIQTAALDGWRVIQNGWHYGIGQRADGRDGWIGFGGRQGAHWIFTRLERVAWLHYPTRTVTPIGGAATYNRANLSVDTESLQVGPNNDTINVQSTVIWAGLWSGVNAQWRVDGQQLKEEIVVSQAARDTLATTYPGGSLSDTYLTLVFRLDAADIPRWLKGEIAQALDGDFDDDDGGTPFALRDSLDRLLAFIPVDDAIVYGGDGLEIARQRLRKRIYHDGTNTWLLVGLRADLLNAMPAGVLVFDPTLTAQPDETNSKDVDIISSAPTTNRNGDAALQIGTEASAGGNAIRSLVAFDISSISAGSTIDTATLSLYEWLAQGAGSRDANLHRLLRNWVEAQATWNNYSTGNAWTTAGADSDGNDRVASASATLSLDATAAAGFVSWSGAGMVADVQAFLDATASNYGWILEAPTIENSGSRIRNVFYSSSHTTASDRPKLVVEYTEASGVTLPALLGGGMYGGMQHISGGL